MNYNNTRTERAQCTKLYANNNSSLNIRLFYLLTNRMCNADMHVK